MIRRWSHIHSLATGLAFGLVLDREALVIFALGIAAGVGAVYLGRFARGFGRSARKIATTAAATAEQRERLVEAEIARKRAAAAEATARAEHHVRRAEEQRAAERKARWEGARDGGWLDRERDDRPTTILGIELDDALPERAS